MGIQTIHGTHKINAWADNNRTFAVTTGEGGIKYLQFILCDNKEEIYLGGAPTISYVITKPNGQSASVLVEIVDESNGIVCVPIQDNLTDAPGLARGEIKVVTTDGVLKFYGINLCVFKGADDNAPMDSAEFDDLIKALQKVSTILDKGTEGTVKLDDVISTSSQYTNPVASRVIAQFLIDNYEPKFIIKTPLPKPSEMTVANRQLCLTLKENSANEFDAYICGGINYGEDTYRWYPVANDTVDLSGYVKMMQGSEAPPASGVAGYAKTGDFYFRTQSLSPSLYICIAVTENADAIDESDAYEYTWFNLTTGGTGADGASAYEIAVANGFEGDETAWLESLKGADGQDGTNGEDGADGYTPVKGVDYFTDVDKEEMVSNVLTQLDGIPDYWQTTLDEGVEEIRRAMEKAGRNKSAFFFYSDAHWSNETTYTAKLAPVLLKYLYKKTPINQTNFGGDIVSAESTDTDTMAYLWDWREQLRDLPNHHSVIGNHDDGNATNNLFSKEYIYAYLFAPEENNDVVWGDGFYYYIDNKSEKTRYLYLDIFYDGVSAAQQEFVKQTLISTPDGWHVVAICHAWFANDYSVYPPVLNGFATETQPFLDMFDNYNARSGDYSNGKGYVELCIGGHYHLDHYDMTDGGIPVIIVEADTIHNRGGSMPQHGTTDEASVSAVICDYNSKKVKIVRIGRGNSFTVDMTSGESTTYYSVTNNLTNVTSSSTLTQVEKNSTYSTTLTPTVGAFTTVVVTMGGTDITSTAYNSETGVVTVSAVTGNIVITAIAQEEEPDTSYTNVIKTSIGTDGEIFNNGQGWADNSRIGSGGIYLGNGSLYVTGHIAIDSTQTNVIRLENINFNKNTTETSVGLAFFDSSFARTTYNGTYNWREPAGLGTHFSTVYDDNGNVVEFTIDPAIVTNTDVAYIALCAEYIGNDSIITINEPIV